MSRTDQLPEACLRARPLIDAYLLDSLDPMRSTLLASHLRDCAACSAELGGVGQLLTVLRSLPEAPASPDLDERITSAAIAAHSHRSSHRSWRADLPRTVVRGAARTTGTVLLTVVSVSLLGGAFVFAAAGFIAPLTDTPFVPSEAPTDAPLVTEAPTPEPTRAATPTPIVIVITPEPTLAPTPSAAPSSEPTPSATATATPAPTARPEPTPQPTPVPTEKPKRTPPPSPTPSPAPSEAPPSP